MASSPASDDPATLAQWCRAAQESPGGGGSLVDLALKRARAFEHLNAFIHLESPHNFPASKPIGPLGGIPFAVKDNIAVVGQPMTCGVALLEGYHPPVDAYVVAKLRDAGAIPLGKTNLDAFGMGSTTEESAAGASLNPWGISYCPGGSSGGSAAAVAAGIVPFALGSDTGGSVRQPGAHCGVVGFKPSYGAYSRRGLVAFASSLDHIGILARRVADIRGLHPILGRRDPGDSTSSAVSLRSPDVPSLRGARFVYPRDLGPVDDDIAGAFEAVLGRLRALGAELSPMDFPDADETLGAYHVLSSAEAASNLARFDGIRYGQPLGEGGLEFSEMIARARHRGLGPEVKRRILLGTLVLEQGRGRGYYLRAHLSRQRIAEGLRLALGGADAILTPTTPAPPFKLGAARADPMAAYRGDRFTAPMNLAGLPAISIPMGLSSQGLPLGLQIAAAPAQDAPLLAMAQGVEASISALGEIGRFHEP